MEITKELVESLTDVSITRSQYDKVIKAISNKVDEIWGFIIESSKRRMTWWAFSNDVSSDDGSSGGTFDPVCDSEFITVYGDNTRWENEFYLYNQGFPTRFLWEDYKVEVQEHVKDCIYKMDTIISTAIANIDKYKNPKESLIQSIRSKLTPEELAIVKFMECND